MSLPEFQAFKSIERFKGIGVIITEKIHGTNAQVYIQEDGQVFAGSRNRWLSVADDNYGFANWVEQNKSAICELLGPGRHFGEWYGAGVNSGYNLKTKRFALFNTGRFSNKPLPEGVDVVPVLYAGKWTETIVEETMAKLKESGSVLVPGFTRPEGVVIFFPQLQTFAKSVFDAEETGWTKGDGIKSPHVGLGTQEIMAMVAGHLQPIRLEKLLSRDERYIRDYPSSLPGLVSDYLADLHKECEVPAVDEKPLKKVVFPWVRGEVESRIKESP